MALPAHLWLEGEKQGKIEGSCDQRGREGAILVQSLEHDISIPHDIQTGLAKGLRVHGKLTIRKEFDKSSPKLYQALCKGEHLRSVKLLFSRIAKTGTEEHYYTIKLEDAIVAGIKSHFPDQQDKQNGTFGHMEDVSFTYRRIIWTWEPDGIESDDDWKEPGR
jgi:type VI secretion system secreted protein Hcp